MKITRTEGDAVFLLQNHREEEDSTGRLYYVSPSDAIKMWEDVGDGVDFADAIKKYGTSICTVDSILINA